jgi:hypothetical protein
MRYMSTMGIRQHLTKTAMLRGTRTGEISCLGHGDLTLCLYIISHERSL